MKTYDVMLKDQDSLSIRAQKFGVFADEGVVLFYDVDDVPIASVSADRLIYLVERGSTRSNGADEDRRLPIERALHDRLGIK